MQTNGTKPLFGSLGLTEVEEQVYRRLLRWDGGSPQRLAETGVAERQARRALASLERQGLVARSTVQANEYVPAPPEAAIGILILKRQEELEQLRLSLRDLADEVAVERRPGEAGEIVELVTGWEAVINRNHQLLMGAKEEILGITVPPMVAPDQGFIEFKLELLRRGVKGRVIYTPGALAEPGAFEFIEALRPAGEEARVVSRAPMAVLIVDRRTALVPAETHRSAADYPHLVVHPSSLLDTLLGMFENLWERAMPFEPGAPVAASTATTANSGEASLSADERRVLALLGAGLQDATIALQLDLGQRTVQRHLRRIMEVLGTRTRFQTGAEAGRRGWLERVEPSTRAVPDESTGISLASAHN